MRLLSADVLQGSAQIRIPPIAIDKWGQSMNFRLTLVAISTMTFLITAPGARAQVDLSAYADANGYLDVQTLTCAQLANTWQQDADMLATWYSGWYNGLACKHYLDVRKGKEVEHDVIEYCKAHQEIRIIDAIAVIFKDERARLGIKMK